MKTTPSDRANLRSRLEDRVPVGRDEAIRLLDDIATLLAERG